MELTKNQSTKPAPINLQINSEWAWDFPLGRAELNTFTISLIKRTPNWDNILKANICENFWGRLFQTDVTYNEIVAREWLCDLLVSRYDGRFRIFKNVLS